MVAPVVRVIGADRIVAGLRSIAPELDTFGEGVDRLSSQAVGWVRSEAPHRSGRLSGSVWGREGELGASAAYAGVIHFGWAAHGISPNPYVVRAMQNHRGESVRILDGGLQDLADRVKGA